MDCCSAVGRKSVFRHHPPISENNYWAYVDYSDSDAKEDMRPNLKCLCMRDGVSLVTTSSVRSDVCDMTRHGKYLYSGGGVRIFWEFQIIYIATARHR